MALPTVALPTVKAPERPAATRLAIAMLAMLVVAPGGCFTAHAPGVGTGNGPPRETGPLAASPSASPSPPSPAPPSSAEVVLTGLDDAPGWMAVAGAFLYGAGGTRLVRARIASPPFVAEAVLSGRGLRVAPAGDAVLVTRGMGADEEALLVDAAGHTIPLGPAQRVTWDAPRQRVLLARPATDDGRIDFVEVPAGDPARARRLTTFHDPSLEPWVSGFTASPGGCFAAFAKRGREPVPGERVFSWTEGAAAWVDRFGEDHAFELHVHGSLLVVGGIELVLRDLRTGARVVPHVPTDACATDGDAYYCLATFLSPPGTPVVESFTVYAWRPGAPRRTVAEGLRGLTGGIALDASHAYWSERPGVVKRLPRLAGY